MSHCVPDSGLAFRRLLPDHVEYYSSLDSLVIPFLALFFLFKLISSSPRVWQCAELSVRGGRWQPRKPEDKVENSRGEERK